MRVYSSSYALMSEITRDVYEMGHLVHSLSMQNKDVGDDDNFITKEITNYSYCLTSMKSAQWLFAAEPTMRKWADAEFKERMDPDPKNPGEAYKWRHEVWEQFLNNEGKFDYTYGERMKDQIESIITELLRNPDSRQAIIMIWDRENDHRMIGGKQRVPCSMYYQILIREGKVHIIYNQRSADVVTHFGNDVYLAWKLKTHIVNLLNSAKGLEYGADGSFKVGYLFHNIGSLHTYKKDWDKLKQTQTEFRD